MTDGLQRWRVFVARGPEARDAPHRDVAAAWEAGLRESGLPLVSTEGRQPQPRVVFAAPVPVGMLADREPFDVWLLERHRIDVVRAALERAAPPGHRVVDLYDVWIGAPSLPASVMAGDYLVTARPAEVDGPVAIASSRVDAAIVALLAEPRIERRREKGGGSIVVDIRPHILELAMAAVPEPGSMAGLSPGPAPVGGPAIALTIRLLLGGERGVGRPEEVVAALGDLFGVELAIDAIVRRRVVLSGEL
jgi:radical SAM-linked protein